MSVRSEYRKYLQKHLYEEHPKAKRLRIKVI